LRSLLLATPRAYTFGSRLPGSQHERCIQHTQAQHVCNVTAWRMARPTKQSASYRSQAALTKSETKHAWITSAIWKDTSHRGMLLQNLAKARQHFPARAYRRHAIVPTCEDDGLVAIPEIPTAILLLALYIRQASIRVYSTVCTTPPLHVQSHMR